MAAPIIDVHGLNKYFGSRHAVRDLSLQVDAGEILGFLGPNGSGKTTTIRMLCGLLTPDSGSGTCLGYDIVRQSLQIKRRVGYMTQRFGYYEDLTIEENLAFVARMYGLRDRQERVLHSLEQLGLSGRRKQLAGALSGGWKQRLALAACLLHDPRLLLLDEPTAGVDPKARRDFWDTLHDLAAGGITVLVSTHYMDEAERCHRLAYIADGQLLAEGAAPAIIGQSHLATWQVTGAATSRLARDLRGLPGVAQVVTFGTALHVSGTDVPVLAASLQQFLTGKPYHLEAIAPSLEDVFIHLMAQSSEHAPDE